LRCTFAEYHVLLSGKEPHIRTKQTVSSTQPLEHNRIKKYALCDGVAYDFLIALGIQNKDGKVKREKFDKFKQIVHFLQLLQPIIDQMDVTKEHVFVDLACGKSYLSFALYHVLTHQGFSVKLYGIDIRSDVIETCQKLQAQLCYHNMHFAATSIES